MRLLLDECTPRRLWRDFPGHTVSTIEQAGLKGLKNGALLLAASASFDALVTIDKNIEYQQNTGDLSIASYGASARSNKLESVLPLMSGLSRGSDDDLGGEIVKIEV